MDKIVELCGHSLEPELRPDLRDKGRPEGGHEERGAHPFPRDIGDDHGQTGGVDGDKIVIISPDLVAGDIRPGNVKIFARRVLLGKEVLLDLGGQGQLLLEFLDLDRLFDGPGVLDLDSGEVGEQGHQPQVVLFELVEQRDAIGIDHPDDLPVVPERHAHGAVDVGLDDAVLHPQPVVGLSVGGQHRRVVVQHEADDALADQDLLSEEVLVVDARHLGDHLGRVALLEHQDPPVHGQILGHQVHDPLQQFIEGLVKDERLTHLVEDRHGLVVRLDLQEIGRSGERLDGRVNVLLFQDVLKGDHGVDIA